MQKISNIVTFLKNWFFKIPGSYINWWLVYLDYLLPKSYSYTARLRNGLLFKVGSHTGDISILNETFINKTYMFKSKHFNLTFNPGDVVLDIGSHIGDFSIYFGQKYSDVEFFCFEPAPRLFNLCKSNIELNNLKNVHVFEFGISSQTRKAAFYLGNNSAIGSLYSAFEESFAKGVASYQKNNEIEVQIHSINEILPIIGKSRIDIIKLDCEGAEYDILYNINYSLLVNIRFLLIEAHFMQNMCPEYNPLKLMEFLNSKGFHCDYIVLNSDAYMLYVSRLPMS